MKKNRQRNKNCNCNMQCSKVGDACKNNRNSSTSNFAKNRGIITDNEYEVTSELETNSSTNSNKSKKKRSK